MKSTQKMHLQKCRFSHYTTYICQRFLDTLYFLWIHIIFFSYFGIGTQDWLWSVDKANLHTSLGFATLQEFWSNYCWLGQVWKNLGFELKGDICSNMVSRILQWYHGARMEEHKQMAHCHQVLLFFVLRKKVNIESIFFRSNLCTGAIYQAHLL